MMPNLPCRDLLTGPREDYVRIAVPLYEASIKCDWKAAKAILDTLPELVRYSITQNGETPLHIAVSGRKSSKEVENFVKNLVDRMIMEDLELENENFNTPLYLAAVAGNLKLVKIMVEKNRLLLIIPGANGSMMPLYAAALFGHYKTVKYLYDFSNELTGDGWTHQNRGWLVENCVEADMFDVALRIIKKHPTLDVARVIASLSRKPEAFTETKSNIITSAVKLVLSFFRFKTGTLVKENDALPLLKMIWETVVNKPKKSIDDLLRGPPDPIKKTDNSASGRVFQALQLQNITSVHLDKLDQDTKKISTDESAATTSQNVVHPFSELNDLLIEYILKMHHEMVIQDDKQVSGNEDQVLQNLIFKHITSLHVDKEDIIRRQSGNNEQKAMDLKNLIKKHLEEMRSVIKIKETRNYSSRVLFIAAENGNTNFLVELIRQDPDLVWKVNDNGLTIFHTAVTYRHEGIYNLLYEIGSLKDMITPLKDGNDNNMLHLAAMSTKKKQLEDVSGAALKMQRELLWFQEVRNMMPPSYRERLNKNGLTPRELFTEEHKDLMTQGEKWMKETASQCMVVAALIATIVFAAAFTVPGGYNQTDGIPIFHKKRTFVIFVVADAISLFSSSASILTFLSILTSRYAERDFLRALPTKLMLGLATLFLSIATMMITFSVSFFILYRHEMKWIPILIGMLAVSPVLLYVVLQYHLIVDVIRSTYGSKYLFKPAKQVLYYKNPRI